MKLLHLRVSKIENCFSNVTVEEMKKGVNTLIISEYTLALVAGPGEISNFDLMKDIGKLIDFLNIYQEN